MIYDEKRRLYDIAERWMVTARNSFMDFDYQGERIAWDYLNEIIGALRTEIGANRSEANGVGQVDSMDYDERQLARLRKELQELGGEAE